MHDTICRTNVGTQYSKDNQHPDKKVGCWWASTYSGPVLSGFWCWVPGRCKSHMTQAEKSCKPVFTHARLDHVFEISGSHKYTRCSHKDAT